MLRTVDYGDDETAEAAADGVTTADDAASTEAGSGAVPAETGSGAVQVEEIVVDEAAPVEDGETSPDDTAAEVPGPRA